MNEKFDPMYVGKGDRPKFEGPPERAMPGGKKAAKAKTYCDGWRKYAEPVAEFMDWHIHSFGQEVKFVSKDYKHVQSMGIPFIEALYEAIQRTKKCQATSPRPVSSSSAPSSSAASRTPSKPPASPRSSTDRDTWTFDIKTDSSKPERSTSPSRTSSK